MISAQRAAQRWERGANGICEWICEEQGEHFMISSLSRNSCVKGKGIDAVSCVLFYGECTALSVSVMLFLFTKPLM